MPVDVGAAAIDRGDTGAGNATRIEGTNPANASGYLDTIEVWAAANIAGFEVATFVNITGNEFSTRDTHTIGNVTSGSKQTFSGLNIDIQTGDNIGCYFITGQIELSVSGVAYWYTNADDIPCTDVTFTSNPNRQMSLYGTGVSITAPTVTTQAASNVEATTATGNGNITNTGGENCDKRGIVYGLTSQGDPGGAAPPGGYDSYEEQTGSFGTGAFTRSLTGLSTGRTYYARAYAHNSAGYNYGAEVSFLTKPAAPTNVQATDGAHTDKVVVTWTKSTGATGYQVYRDGSPLGWLGDVATYDDTGADPPTITPGAAAASDGTSSVHVALSLSGQGTNNGTTHTYKVRARNATGESADSGTNTGYRGVGALTYQWQRSAADSDMNYANIPGATTASYNDTGAPGNGEGRYYQCVENAAGAAQQTSSSDRGYRWMGEKTAHMSAKMLAGNLM